VLLALSEMLVPPSVELQFLVLRFIQSKRKDEKKNDSALPFSPCCNASSNSPVASSSSPKSCLGLMVLGNMRYIRREHNAPHKITLTPNNAMDRLAWSGTNCAHRECFRGWFGDAVKTFGGVLWGRNLIQHLHDRKESSTLSNG